MQIDIHDVYGVRLSDIVPCKHSDGTVFYTRRLTLVGRCLGVNGGKCILLFAADPSDLLAADERRQAEADEERSRHDDIAELHSPVRPGPDLGRLAAGE